MKTQPGLRDRKKARTRDTILGAATRLYLAEGYDATTVEQIAEAAGVGRRTFFRYFPRKDDTVFPNQEERLGLFRQRLAAHRASLPPYPAVTSACLEVARVFSGARDELVAQFAIVRGSPALIARQAEFDARWEQAVFEALLPAGAPHPAERRHARVFAGALMGLVRVLLDAWMVPGAEGDLVAQGAEALGWLERGYGASFDGLARGHEGAVASTPESA